MIIFWILTLFAGSSAFAFSYIYLQYDVLSSLGFALVTMLICRGLLSMVRRWLILRESITPEKDTQTRTVETNRAIFWRRALFVAAVPVLYFIGAYYLFQLEPLNALDALPSAIVSGLTNLLYILFLLAANFMLFLGPFYIYTRIGKTMINPDDANDARWVELASSWRLVLPQRVQIHSAVVAGTVIASSNRSVRSSFPVSTPG